MSLKKKAVLIILAAIVVLLNIGIILHPGKTTVNMKMNVTLSGNVTGDIQAFYATQDIFAIEKSETFPYKTAGEETTLTFTQPSDTTFMRLDFGNAPGVFQVTQIEYVYKDFSEKIDLSMLADGKSVKTNDIESAVFSNGVLTVTTKGEDPHIEAAVGPTDAAPEIAGLLNRNNLIKNLFYAGILDLFCVLLIVFRNRFSTLPRELIQNRHLIMQLAKNDFRTRYAGSVLGITWAFVQPAITVVIYWFVFQVGLHSGDVTTTEGTTYPFVLWLIAGLVPWFFFQDTLASGTNALMEYSYLVKKVVFKISILPIVKEISALFVHIFFVALMVFLFVVSGHFPGVYVLQIIYYSLALFMYGLGICYLTCAIVIFFRDLTQIINIIIQVQVWLTPIMWNIDTMGSSMPGWLIVIFKLNPMYYIVNGYRDSMMNHVWFWNRLDLTVYFWVVTVLFFALGTFVFKRLKVHFADIL
jgi:teichoic acid transport system permease protein